MTARRMKRFYREAGAVPVEGGFAIQLDSKSVKTPARKNLVVPSHALAARIAGEWAAQEGEIVPENMPFTKFAFTAIDRVAELREAVIEQIAAYANSDVLCYRATYPADLVARQEKEWTPLLLWAEEEFGAELQTAEGLAYVTQGYEALEALTDVFREADAFQLTGLSMLASELSSLVLALAVWKGRLAPETAFVSAHLEELYQADKWGRDDEAEKRFNFRAAEFRAAAEFLAMVGE
jgi:chaperone required for assembly of F1-ATPase